MNVLNSIIKFRESPSHSINIDYWETIHWTCNQSHQSISTTNLGCCNTLYFSRFDLFVHSLYNIYKLITMSQILNPYSWRSCKSDFHNNRLFFNLCWPNDFHRIRIFSQCLNTPIFPQKCITSTTTSQHCSSKRNILNINFINNPSSFGIKIRFLSS